MNDITPQKENLENNNSSEQKKNITDTVESSIEESFSKTPFTPDQKMDKMGDGIQNINNGINQMIELFKQMMKTQIETTNTTNKMIAEQTHTMNTLISGQENKNKPKTENKNHPGLA